MPYVRDSFWRGREFTSLTQMQAAAALSHPDFTELFDQGLMGAPATRSYC